MPGPLQEDPNVPSGFQKPRRARVIRRPWELIPYAIRTLVGAWGEGDDPDSAIRVMEGLGGIPRERVFRKQVAWQGELTELTSRQLGRLRDRLDDGDTALAVALLRELGYFNATPNTWESLFGLEPGAMGS